MKRLICALLLCLTILQAQAASLSASVDRTQLNAGETFDLTLESDDNTAFGTPDLSPLTQQFRVIGTRQENRLSSLDGKAHASTRWIVTLQAKHTGNVVIPPLNLGSAESQSITLSVTEPDTSAPGKLAPVFIDASLDRESVYVQAQALLTLRIYHSVSLYDDSSLTPLSIPDARVQQLGSPRTYETSINGVRHGVIEVSYAIFPQKSGPLTIPSQIFSATPALPSSADDYNPFGPRPGRQTQVNSPEIPLQVKPRPDSWPANAPWLPASSLSLSEAWTPEPGSSLKIGDSLTRNVMLRAEGLASAQLPPLPEIDVAGLRRYPDKPQMHNQNNEHGLVGSREESLALVPSKSGRIELPEVRLQWWNTDKDRLETATLPARQLEVENDPSLEVDAPVTSRERGNPVQILLWPWQLACLLLSLTTLLGFGLWWRARRQPAILPSTQNGPSPRTLLDDLKRACQAKDPHVTRQALDAWARQQPETLADMGARFAPLSDALDELNGALYSETGHQWQGETLWQAIRDLPAAETVAQPQDNSALPPLYPR